MPIYGNVIGGTGALKTVVLEDPSGVEIWGTITESDQMLTAKPSDVRIGKTVVTSDGIIEGTNTINYRTQAGSYLVLPGENFSIPLQMYNQYDYTKFQAIIVLFSADYSNSVKTMGISINDSVFSVETSEKISNISRNEDTKSIDLNITNNTSNIYSIRYFTYHEEMEE